MSERSKISLPALFKKVEQGKPITMLTCYDYPTAYFQERGRPATVAHRHHSRFDTP